MLTLEDAWQHGRQLRAVLGWNQTAPPHLNAHKPVAINHSAFVELYAHTRLDERLWHAVRRIASHRTSALERAAMVEQIMVDDQLFMTPASCPGAFTPTFLGTFLPTWVLASVALPVVAGAPSEPSGELLGKLGVTPALLASPLPSERDTTFPAGRRTSLLVINAGSGGVEEALRMHGCLRSVWL